ncbi:uncharacterized protein HaLaN_11744 [Haematococcus lacustris]|uniref:Uncharacterized protein n=1 Tax=Haematococcus lacustris TaxID=44745 RepID=A0A699Z1W3_HAELA|nr:uncharacterized protein HaLaN_11744 [Haematococcus lacustris]
MHVAFGALDKAHNLVTPLSWGGRTEYGGEPIPKSPAAKEAAYVHALVHRCWQPHAGIQLLQQVTAVAPGAPAANEAVVAVAA